MPSADVQYEINQYKQMAASNNEFNAKEAATNRDFQERMSSTAHQREVKDLVSAGLNPVLSANAGAQTPAGSMAQADTSANSAMATSFSSKRQAETQLKTAQIQANATMAAAASAAGAAMYAADVQSRTQIRTNLTNAIASILNTQTSSSSTMWGLINNWLLRPLDSGIAAGLPNGMFVSGNVSASQYEQMMKLIEQYYGTGAVDLFIK